MQVGQRVEAVKMASDSFYKKVIGTVTKIENGFVSIDADIVMSKWDDEYQKHPTFCSTAARIENVVAL